MSLASENEKKKAGKERASFIYRLPAEGGPHDQRWTFTPQRSVSEVGLPTSNNFLRKKEIPYRCAQGFEALVNSRHSQVKNSHYRRVSLGLHVHSEEGHHIILKRTVR